MGKKKKPAKKSWFEEVMDQVSQGFSPMGVRAGGTESKESVYQGMDRRKMEDAAKKAKRAKRIKTYSK